MRRRGEGSDIGIYRAPSPSTTFETDGRDGTLRPSAYFDRDRRRTRNEEGGMREENAKYRDAAALLGREFYIMVYDGISRRVTLMAEIRISANSRVRPMYAGCVNVRKLSEHFPFICFRDVRRVYVRFVIAHGRP